MKKWVSGSKPDNGRAKGSTRVRVRYAETDAMGWVYYATYLCYFEVGRTELIRELWMPYREVEEQGTRLPVVESGCRYITGARYDDELEIRTQITLPSAFRVRFDYDIVRISDGQEIARGFTEHCFLSADGKLVRAPHDLRELIAA
jgi:acyl-CoA thioester hydrolase